MVIRKTMTGSLEKLSDSFFLNNSVFERHTVQATDVFKHAAVNKPCVQTFTLAAHSRPVAPALEVPDANWNEGRAEYSQANTTVTFAPRPLPVPWPIHSAVPHFEQSAGLMKEMSAVTQVQAVMAQVPKS
jgi:hypothetical protein